MTTELSTAEARMLALHAQGLMGERGHDPRAMLRRVGAVQLDTISVLARSHELVAYARLGRVDRAAVEDAYWGRPPRAFEAFAHAMCILPLELWPHFAARRRLSARRIHPRRPPNDRSMQQVLAELRAAVRPGVTTADLSEQSLEAEPPFGRDPTLGLIQSAEQTVIFPLDDPVALACGRLQARPVEDGNAAPAVADEPGLLEDASDGVDARPAHAQHLREEFLGQRKCIRRHAVVGHEQPAGAPLLDCVKAVAGGCLRHLHLLGEYVPLRHAPKRWRIFKVLLKCCRSDSQARSGHLHYRTRWRVIETKCRRNTYNSLASRYSHFYAAPVCCNHNQGNHPCVEEVGMLNFLSLIVKYLVTRQRDRFQ